MADRADAIVEACMGHLARLPFIRDVRVDARHRGQAGPDVTIAVETPTGRERLACEVRASKLSRESAEHIARQLRRLPATMLFANGIGRDLGDFFESVDVSFVDTLGNCYVRIADRYMARIQGRAAPPRRAIDRSLGAATYRALFALLARQELVAAPVRTIAAASDVSPQTAANLLASLVDRGIVLQVRRRRRWAPGRRQEALETWLTGFRATLAPSLLIGRYRAKETDPRELERRIEPILDELADWRYGGGAAASRLSQHYRGDRTILYVRDDPADLPARLRLVRDPQGPVVLARAPGIVAFDSPDPRAVHPLLTYADLLTEDHDRAREAAAVLHERFLTEREKAE